MTSAAPLRGSVVLLIALLSAQVGVAQSLYDPSRLELRAGYLMGIAVPFLRAGLFPERGTGDVNLELVLPKYWRLPDWRDALLPRLHLGATANVDARTSYAYGGVLWTFDYAARAFAELSLGGLVHNGQLANADAHLARLGCRQLYEVGFNLGYRISARLSALLTFDHGSNGRGYLSSCQFNEGLNVLGARLGYRF